MRMVRQWTGDALHAEVAYRVEEMRKAGKAGRAARNRRWSRERDRTADPVSHRTDERDPAPRRRAA
ncbi:hypothetical protein [Qaidamihabitans albus]|uniref:hypothetical protein n=1 Tax=Qaidamihabitans albus TaxID=2795733 RepID=UPI0018F25481|nr:hypothetical protein [Qaidamihabitans albus]